MFRTCSQRHIWKFRRLEILIKIQNTYFTSTSYFTDKTSSNFEHDRGGFIPFLQNVNLRRAEAKRSLLVQVQSPQSYKELNSYCSIFGTVKQMFHYSVGVEPLHFILVEFEEQSEVQNLLKNTSYVDETLIVPTYSHFLWFKAQNKKSPKVRQIDGAVLSIENGTRILSDHEIISSLRQCENISEQMKLLYSLTKLNYLGSRLRYLTVLQIDNMVSGMFPHAQAYPFGSSVNGYGKMGCDLDLVLRLVDKKSSEESRLMFHCKVSNGSERSTNQRHIEAFGDMIHLFLPGCVQVRRIVQARIPIIKYHQQLTDVECDLSIGNM
ncbi:unnamed protein product [Acanthoscelides obtectus]|uniref:Poly(A) RNA polymerase mitochondrial-like central palm domain-containing protein n=1 Tax=Acanthoscelides obtectus TaxID=200917 RepID=A0A9P0MIZ9_ACAOB|nr:unnamed protein product [Acanthoscelides obtectus]CAK1641438.1 Poly(A) RNA polymerase, mitochondrial [Acanthoscelides obtectus]